jgi:hypothetical protein
VTQRFQIVDGNQKATIDEHARVRALRQSLTAITAEIPKLDGTTAANSKERQHEEAVVVDGSNACFAECDERGRPRLSNLVTVRQLLLDHALEPIILCDANLLALSMTSAKPSPASLHLARAPRPTILGLAQGRGSRTADTGAAPVCRICQRARL